MNLYLISQDSNNDYDTYDAAVVVASTEEEAKGINPSGRDDRKSSWVTESSLVRVQFIGTAAAHLSAGVICASFNAG